MAIVYTHIRLDTNEVFYVGIGKNQNRAYASYNRSSWWSKIANKSGYKVVITHKNILWEEACSIEKNNF